MTDEEFLAALESCHLPAAQFNHTRMLHAMAQGHKAAKLFGALNRRGVPIAALLATGMVSTLAFFSTTVGDKKIWGANCGNSPSETAYQPMLKGLAPWSGTGSTVPLAAANLPPRAKVQDLGKTC